MASGRDLLLAVDVGNTHIVGGVFRGDELVADWRQGTVRSSTADEIAVTTSGLLALHRLDMRDVAILVVSSVVPSLAEEYRRFAEAYVEAPAVVVGPGTRTGMRIAIDDPREVGADRIVNAVAAWERFGRPCIVVDMGTATTYDAIGRAGEYLGGAIAPGLGISVEALVSRAARLATVDLVVPETAIGTNTARSMQSGAMLGTVAQVEGMLRRFRHEMGEPDAPAVATGGLAGLIGEHVDRLEVDPLLTLRGLRLIATMQP